MRRARRLLMAFLCLFAAASLSGWSLKSLFAQEKAEELEANSPDLPIKVLIATQGSSFKKALVARLVEAIGDLPAYVRVADLSGLAAVNPKEWKAVVVVSACESSRLHLDAEAFAKRIEKGDNVVVVVTSGSGRWTPEDCPVDCISAASRKSRVEALAAEILRRIGGGSLARSETR
jgi:hypothetical protein